MAATFIPISFGWAAGDVSLAAYIQASLARGGDATTAGISTLGAVMSFLYVTYVRTPVLLLYSHVDGLFFLRLLPMRSFPLSLGAMWTRKCGMYLDAMGPPLIQLMHNADKIPYTMRSSGSAGFISPF